MDKAVFDKKFSTMNKAQKHSANNNTQAVVKSKLTEVFFDAEFILDDFAPTNNRLAKKSEKLLNPETSHYISQCSDKSIGIMEILNLKKILNYKDLRSVIQWCRKNDVFIFHQGNKQFVNKGEFVLSFYKPFIKHLKKKHKNWKEMFLGYVRGNLINLLGFSQEERTVPTTYKPNDKSEASFLNKIREI